MKFLITQKQKDLIDLQKVAKKYFSKFGTRIDENFLSFFNMSASDASKFLTNYLGLEKAQKISQDLLKKNPHHIGGDFICGGYNFEFYIDNIQFISDEDRGVNKINVDCYLNESPKNQVYLMALGTNQSLSDAISDDEYGWEIKKEIWECVEDYLQELIISNTGLLIYVESFEFK